MRLWTAGLAGIALIANLLILTPAKAVEKESVKKSSEVLTKPTADSAPSHRTAQFVGFEDASKTNQITPDTHGNESIQDELNSIPREGPSASETEGTMLVTTALVPGEGRWIWAVIIAFAVVLGSGLVWVAWQVIKLRHELEAAERRAKPNGDAMQLMQDVILQLGERVSNIEMNMPRLLAGRLAPSGTAPTFPRNEPQPPHPDEPPRHIPDAPDWVPASTGRDPRPAYAPTPEPINLEQAEEIAIKAVANAVDPDEFEASLRRLGDLRNALERDGKIYVSDRYLEDPSAEIVAVVLNGEYGIIVPSSDYIRIFSGNSNIHSAPSAIRTSFELTATGESRLELAHIAQGRLALDGSLIDFRKGRLSGFSGSV